jgi:hypothetical protein
VAVLASLALTVVAASSAAAPAAAGASASDRVSLAGAQVAGGSIQLAGHVLDGPWRGVRAMGVSLDSPPVDDGDGPTATPLQGEYAAYVTAIDPAHATVTFDVFEWFTGAAAQQACTQDGNPGPWPAELCNDYYIRDRNVVLRTLPVAPQARLRYVAPDGPADGVSLDNPTGGDAPATLSQLAAKLAQLGPGGRLKCLIKVESGALTAIAEIFTP